MIGSLALLGYGFFALGSPSELNTVAGMARDCGFTAIELDLSGRGPWDSSLMFIDRDAFWRPDSEAVRTCLFQKVDNHMFSVEFFIHRSEEPME